VFFEAAGVSDTDEGADFMALSSVRANFLRRVCGVFSGGEGSRRVPQTDQKAILCDGPGGTCSGERIKCLLAPAAKQEGRAVQPARPPAAPNYPPPILQERSAQSAVVL